MKTARWALLVGISLTGTTSALAPAPAKAGGIIWFHGEDCSPGTKPKQAKPEWRPEARFTTIFEKMNCCDLANFAESQRFLVNQHALGAYMRPISSFGISTAPAPAPPPPATPSTTPPTTSAPASSPTPDTSPTSTPDTGPAPLPETPPAQTKPK